MSDVLGDIITFKEDFDKKVLLNTKGHDFNQRQLIDMFETYWNSCFLDGDQVSEAYKFFYNILKFPVRISAKMVDLDTKDIRFTVESGQPFVNGWIFNKEMKAWMKDVNFGTTLNGIIQRLPKYGNHVLKTVKGKPFNVRLRDLVVDTEVEFMKQSYIIDEVHFMSPAEIKKMKKWDSTAVKEILEQAKEQKKSYIQIDEAYFPNEKKIVIVANLDSVKYDKEKKNVIEDKSRILFENKYPRFPYTEFFWDEFQGRWLRQGVLEELLEEQFAANETFFLHMLGLHWSQKHIFKTDDQMITKNIMRDVENGEILRVNGDITQLDVADRDLASVNITLNALDKNKREKSMIFEPITGETMPSATPFRLGFILQRAASGYFDMKREDIGLQLKKYITEIVVPEFKKNKRTKHLFNFTGVDDELALVEKFLVESKLTVAIKKQIEAGRGVPTEDEINVERKRLSRKLENRTNRQIKMADGEFENIKYKLDLLITGESADVGSIIDTLTTTLQTIATNPGILQNPATRKILFTILDKAGINPEELGLAQQRPEETLSPEAIDRFSPPPGPKRRSEPTIGQIERKL